MRPAPFRTWLLLALAAIGCGSRRPLSPPGAASVAWRDYERWYSAARPPALLDDAVPLYRSALADAGLSSAEIDRRTADFPRIILERGRSYWNQVLTAPHVRFNAMPNRFLAQSVHDLPPGRALDCGMGQGRNAIYLAGLGWDVTGFDIADEALAQARRQAEQRNLHLEAVLADADHFDFGHERWDLIVITYAPVREVARRVVEGLKPGGRLLVEGFGTERGADAVSANVAFRPGELPALFPTLRILQSTQSTEVPDFGGPGPRLLVRLLAQKP